MKRGQWLWVKVSTLTLPAWVSILAAGFSIAGAILSWMYHAESQEERASEYVVAAEDLLRSSFPYPSVLGEPEGDSPQLIERRDKAAERLHLALRMRPSASLASTARSLLGVVFIQQRDFGRALSELKRAIHLDPRNADAYSDMGLVYWSERPPTIGATSKTLLDAPDEAFRNALAINPQSLDALNGEAAVYQARGQFPEAQKDIEKAIKIDPQDADSRFDLGPLPLS